MNRKEKLLKIIDDDEVLLPLVDEIIFLEGQLEELKKLPFLRVNPKNNSQQKPTAAAKQEGGHMAEEYCGVKVYKCDPEKNKDCDKKLCQTECFYTANKQYAKEGGRNDGK